MVEKIWDFDCDFTSLSSLEGCPVRIGGDLVAYHNYDRSLFRDYLFTHTVIDTPSSTKHKFGEVVRAINGIDSVFSLGLQIRFHNKPQLLKENKDEEVSVKSRKP